MEFLYDDPRWTPEAARQTPLEVFAFDGVEVVEQQDELAVPGTPEDALAQVQGFDYHHASGVIVLSAFNDLLGLPSQRPDADFERYDG
jgi:hypothetical protein